MRFHSQNEWQDKHTERTEMAGAEQFDILTIGAGAAGLVTAIGGAALGKKSALVEARLMGGDCTNFGCIPSKALLAAARAAHGVGDTERFGIGAVEGFKPDFAGAMRRVREIVEHVRSHESPEEIEKLGVRVILGRAAFKDDRTVIVRDGNGETIRELTAKDIVIATGSYPVIPSVPGIDGIDVLTNETIFDLTALPHRMIVIGGGPIGAEIGQAFARLGSEVTILEALPRILSKEETHVSDLMARLLAKDGVRIFTSTKIEGVARTGSEIAVRIQTHDGKPESVAGDAVFIAAGRRANVRDLDLDAAGVSIDGGSVKVNRYFQTSRPHIYACGDTIGGYLFTHVAEAEAKAVLRNILFPLIKSPMNYDVIPWVTFTDPEVAHVGLSIEQAGKKYGTGKIKVYNYPLSKLDRAITESEDTGFIEIVTKKLSGRILGANIVGPRAGDVIAEICMAMKYRVPVYRISGIVHAYPTYALGVRKAADLYFSETLAEMLSALKARLFFLRGKNTGKPNRE